MLEQNNNKIVFNVDEIIKNNPHYKGYIYDSLVYRYMRAREAMARLEIREGASPTTAFNEMRRDNMRFSEILNEVIGEHD
jgi:hypothetical protein